MSLVYKVFVFFSLQFTIHTSLVNPIPLLISNQILIPTNPQFSVDFYTDVRTQQMSLLGPILTRYLPVYSRYKNILVPFLSVHIKSLKRDQLFSFKDPKISN